MSAPIRKLATVVAIIGIAGATAAAAPKTNERKNMELGNFSVSLAVRDIKAS